MSEAFNNHKGRGKFDFAYSPASNDRWTINDRTYNAHEFGNVLAGYTGGFNFGWAGGTAIVMAAGVFAHAGDNGWF